MSAVKLTPEILTKALSTKYDNLIVKSCEFFPKKEYKDGEWVQTNSYLVNIQYDNSKDVNVTVGSVSQEVKAGIEDIERIMGIEIILDTEDMVPVLITPF
jgi:hypothetical protein